VYGIVIGARFDAATLVGIGLDASQTLGHFPPTIAHDDDRPVCDTDVLASIR
jgi:hypothetical protein